MSHPNCRLYRLVLKGFANATVQQLSMLKKLLTLDQPNCSKITNISLLDHALSSTMIDLLIDCIVDERNRLKRLQPTLLKNRSSEPNLIKLLLAFRHPNNKIEEFSVNRVRIYEELQDTLETTLKDKDCKIRCLVLENCDVSEQCGSRLLWVAKQSLVDQFDINEWRSYQATETELTTAIREFSIVAKSKSFKKINALLSVHCIPRLGKNTQIRMLSFELLRVIISRIQFEP
jgi:hypothetical protein